MPRVEAPGVCTLHVPGFEEPPGCFPERPHPVPSPEAGSSLTSSPTCSSLSQYPSSRAPGEPPAVCTCRPQRQACVSGPISPPRGFSPSIPTIFFTCSLDLPLSFESFSRVCTPPSIFLKIFTFEFIHHCVPSGFIFVSKMIFSLSLTLMCLFSYCL